jgi:hypothetical protein
MPTEQFVASVRANLAFWLDRTQGKSDLDIVELDQDRHNLRRAIEFGLDLPDTQAQAGELALQAMVLVERRGYWREWIAVLRRLLASNAPVSPRLRGLAMGALGTLLRLDHQLPEAVAAHREAEALMLALGDGEQVARIQHALSEDYRLSRQYGALRACRWKGLLAGPPDVAGKSGTVLNTPD